MKKIFKFLAVVVFSLCLVTNGYCAWDETKPADNEKLKDTPALLRANWDAIKLGTDPDLLVTNDKVSPTAGIVDTKLAAITTADKVNVSAIGGTLGIGHGGTGLTTAGGTANRIMGTTNGSSFGLLQVDLASAMITGTLPIANGGTGITSAGGVANRVLLTTDGSAFATGQVALASMVTGTLGTGNGGTGATANANAANGVVILDSNGKMPAIDGSNMTGISSATVFTNIQVFTSSGTWTKPAGVDRVYVKCWGTGGNGGSSGGNYNAAGGGGGGYSEGLVTVTGNVTVTIDGTSSRFAGSTTPTANVGSNGSDSNPGAGGAGGSASGGTINLSGGAGARSGNTFGPSGGGGGGSPMGGAGGQDASGNGNGYAGVTPGGGGSGGWNGSGGSGGGGMVIVYY